MDYRMTGPDMVSPDHPRIALVVFLGEADLKWLKILKPGFRHCFAIFESDGRCVIYDPLSHQTEITVIEEFPIQELMRGYRELGFRVVPWALRRVPPQAGAVGTLHLRRGNQTGSRHPRTPNHNSLEFI